MAISEMSLSYKYCKNNVLHLFIIAIIKFQHTHTHTHTYTYTFSFVQAAHPTRESLVTTEAYFSTDGFLSYRLTNSAELLKERINDVNEGTNTHALSCVIHQLLMKGTLVFGCHICKLNRWNNARQLKMSLNAEKVFMKMLRPERQRWCKQYGYGTGNTTENSRIFLLI